MQKADQEVNQTLLMVGETGEVDCRGGLTWPSIIGASEPTSVADQ